MITVEQVRPFETCFCDIDIGVYFHHNGYLYYKSNDKEAFLEGTAESITFAANTIVQFVTVWLEYEVQALKNVKEKMKYLQDSIIHVQPVYKSYAKSFCEMDIGEYFLAEEILMRKLEKTRAIEVLDGKYIVFASDTPCIPLDVEVQWSIRRVLG